jgi:hypothetical protein
MYSIIYRHYRAMSGETFNIHYKCYKCLDPSLWLKINPQFVRKELLSPKEEEVYFFLSVE